MAINTASTGLATKIEQIKGRVQREENHTASAYDSSMAVDDRAYLLWVIEQIEHGVKYEWSDNEGEVSTAILRLLNA